MKPRKLTQDEITLCESVVGSYAFFHIAMDALIEELPVSTIRVSDGEKRALDYAEGRPKEDLLLCCDEGFRKRFGVEGITCGEVVKRIHAAVEECTYFAPTLGFFNEAYNLTPYFRRQEVLLCEMYQYHWPWARRKLLLQEAHKRGQVLVINRDPRVAENLSQVIGFPVLHVGLNNWHEAEDVLEYATKLGPSLTLMSAALGSKYIGPRLSVATSSVVLDIGQAADIWHLEGK